MKKTKPVKKNKAAVELGKRSWEKRKATQKKDHFSALGKKSSAKKKNVVIDLGLD